MMIESKNFPVIIVGAGPAGIGMSRVLQTIEIEHVVLEGGSVGASFLSWPREMRFISPSFTGNSFGMPDLNAVTHETSPAFSLKTEHPSGEEFARYLSAVASHFSLPVKTGVFIERIERTREGYRLVASTKEYICRYLIWAGGEFGYPNDMPFPGSELCVHIGSIESYASLSEGPQVVIGGYESGFDVATWLLEHGRTVTVIDKEAPWDGHASDSSISLSPYTRDRLRSFIGDRRLTLLPGHSVKSVERISGRFRVRLEHGKELFVKNRPILATGFSGSAKRFLSEHFEWSRRGRPLLRSTDESTVSPGIFLVGSHVEHGSAIFCFIYKFRQRFVVVAEEIARRLKVRSPMIKEYRKTPGFYLKDVSRCGDECSC